VNNYGIPDPGMQNPGDFGNAATNVYSPQSPAAGVPAAQGSGKYEDVAGKGWRVKLPNGGYRMLKEHEYRGLGITPASEEKRLTDIQSKADRDEIKRDQERKQGIVDRRGDRDHGLQRDQFEEQREQNRASNATRAGEIGILGQQVANQGKQNENQFQIQKAGVDEQRNARIDANTHRTEELGLTRQQMQLNNEIQQAKLLQEGRQFERQVALDEKNSRRTKVLGALTLIAQSASRL
jgi:hypothetical protein